MRTDARTEKLYKCIVRTLCYFDIFEYPLTAFEIWQYLYSGDGEIYTYTEVTAALDNFKENIVGRKNEFYFLKGREAGVEKRKDRYKKSIFKFKKAKRIIKILSLFPFVRMIAVCNSLAICNSRTASDIDIFVVTENRKIWTARFFVTTFLRIFRLRPRRNNSQDKICPSFFISEQSLDLKKYRIHQHDLYLLYWISTIVPMYVKHNFDIKFFNENIWIKSRLPNVMLNAPVYERKIEDTERSQLIKKFLTKIFVFDFFESNFKRYQQKKFPKIIKELANKDTRVVIGDSILKFHSTDNRDEYFNRFKKNLEQYETLLGKSY